MLSNANQNRPKLGVAESPLTDDDYQFLCQLVYERSRIHLGPDKRVLVTSRLAKRLLQSDKPIGWFVSQVWDRFADRALWSSQQAVHNVREEADVVLYLVNAAENPEDAGYVTCTKSFEGRTPRTMVGLTAAGRRALDAYLVHMEALIRQTRNG